MLITHPWSHFYANEGLRPRPHVNHTPGSRSMLMRSPRPRPYANQSPGIAFYANEAEHPGLSTEHPERGNERRAPGTEHQVPSTRD